MRYELRRVDPLRAANVGGIVYGVLTAVFALLALPFVLLAVIALPGEQGALGALALPLLLLFYPLIGAVAGWVSGLVSSAIYNLIVRWTGGILLDLSAETPPAGPPS